MKFFSADLKEKTATLDDLNRLIYEGTQRKESLAKEYDEEVAELRVKFIAESHAKKLHIDDLTREVASLEARKAEALKPLDDYKRSLDVKESELAIERKSIDKEYENIAEKKNEYEILIEQAKELSTDLHGKMAKADQKLDRASSIEASVINREKDFILRVDLFNSHVSSKEKELANREDLIENDKLVIEAKDKAFIDRKKKLDDEERAINDKYKTLLRTESRLKPI